MLQQSFSIRYMFYAITQHTLSLIAYYTNIDTYLHIKILSLPRKYIYIYLLRLPILLLLRSASPTVMKPCDDDFSTLDISQKTNFTYRRLIVFVSSFVLRRLCHFSGAGLRIFRYWARFVLLPITYNFRRTGSFFFNFKVPSYDFYQLFIWRWRKCCSFSLFGCVRSSLSQSIPSYCSLHTEKSL